MEMKEEEKGDGKKKIYLKIYNCNIYSGLFFL